MDKYEFNVKLDQIKKLVQKKDYRTASKVAKGLELKKVKDWTTFGLLINVHEAAGDYEEARETAILAYNKNLGGRRLVYKLTEICIKLKDFDEAYECCKDYGKMAPRDPGKYILLYKLKKAEGADAEELIDILEDYREHEVDEKYLCELATLYSKIGDKERCVEECDEIISIFRDGSFVERAIKLKQQYAELTPAQQRALVKSQESKAQDEEYTSIVDNAIERAKLERGKTQEIVNKESLDIPVFLSSASEGKVLNVKEEDLIRALTGAEADVKAADDEQVKAEIELETKSQVKPEDDDDTKVFEMDALKATDVEEELESENYDDLDESDDAPKKVAEENSDDDEEEVEEKPSVGSRFKAFLSKTLLVPEEEDDEEDEDDDETEIVDDTIEIPNLDLPELDADDTKIFNPEDLDAVATEVNEIDAAVESENDEVKNTVAALDESEIESEVEEHKQEQDAESKLRTVIKLDADTRDFSGSSSAIAAAGDSIRQLIDAAKKRNDENYELVKQEHREEELDEAASKIEVPVRDYGIYDTQNLQKELAKSLSEIFSEDDVLRPRPAKVEQEILTSQAEVVEPDDEQIEGQMSIADWVEAVREEKYSHQSTKEYSKAELEAELAKREQDQADYEKIKADLKSNALSAKERERKVAQQVAVNAAKTDLLIRTGKAIAKLEDAIDEQRRLARLEKLRLEQERLEAEARAERERLEAEAKAEQERLEAEAKALREKYEAAERAEKERIAAENIAKAEEAAKAELAKVEADNNDSQADAAEADAVAAVEAALAQEVAKEEIEAEAQAQIGDKEMQQQVAENIQMQLGLEEAQIDAVSEASIADIAQSITEAMMADEENRSVDRYETKPIMELPEDVKRYFKKYANIEGLEDTLVDFYAESVLRCQENTSSSGNIMISGNRSSDKTSLAINIVKGLNIIFPENPRKIARTTGENINVKGFVKSIEKLKGKVLIIEEASAMEPRRVVELLSAMDTDTQGLIIILEDSDTELNMFLDVNPGVAKKFNHRIVLKHYTVNEMVEMAKKYAVKNGYTIDDNALLQLYLNIDRLKAKNDEFKTEDIFLIIDDAIAKADDRVNNRKAFSGFKKKRNEVSNVLIESDFQ